MPRLKNKICLITGAARGIGRAVAELFHQEGATIIISDIDQEELSQFQTAFSERHDSFHLDVSSEADWIKAADLIKQKYGKLDVLVNNAGISGYLQTPGPHNPESLDLASWHKVMAVNADGVALGCKYAIALMKAQRSGSIINMSSRSGIVGIPQMTAYAASKAAVRNHTKSVALYCAEKGYNIRCNSLHPGAILTSMWDPMFAGDKNKMIDEVASQIPLGRMGAPLDVAYAALYLAADESAYVTGIEINIDGGILAGSSARSQEQK
jgi:3(or 17)beta-hydroxysteroid dehydrogenase